MASTALSSRADPHRGEPGVQPPPAPSLIPPESAHRDIITSVSVMWRMRSTNTAARVIEGAGTHHVFITRRSFIFYYYGLLMPPLVSVAFCCWLTAAPSWDHACVRMHARDRGLGLWDCLRVLVFCVYMHWGTG